MANGRGTVYIRNGQWTINFTANGKRVRETVGGTRRIAERVLQTRLTEAIQDRYFKKRDMDRTAFRELGQLYLDRVVPHMKSARSERIRVLCWMKHFGSRPIGQITRNEIEELQRQQRATLLPATANRNLGRLRRLLNVAVSWGLLEESPMKTLKFLVENNRRHRYLSVEEADKLVNACISPRVRAVVILALHTGMRLGEILNLRIQDIDFTTGLILIRDSKNGCPRHLPADATVVELLTNYPRHPNSDLVFATTNGTKLKGVRDGFKNACNRAGLSDLHFHDLRHTFASQWVMAGGDLYLLKEILGHKSIVMTQRYSHLSPKFVRSAINVLNKIYPSSADGVGKLTEMVSSQPLVTPASQTQAEA